MDALPQSPLSLPPATNKPPPSLPTGTVTFLFTDIEGSTQLLDHLHDRYATVLADQRDILRAAFARSSGHEVDTQGDSFFVAFARATDAIGAVVDSQRALAAHHWAEGATVRVRMGLHTGEPRLTSTGYVGLDVHRAARICAAGHGGQVLLSLTTRDLVENELAPGITLHDLGEHRLKDLKVPTHLFQLVIPDLPSDFPPLKTLDTQPNNLPTQPTALIGREQEVATLRQVLLRPDVRLVTLTGAGGSGKTRLGLQVGAELLDDFSDGVFFVALSPIGDPTLVVSTIAQTLGVRETEGQSLLEQVQEHLHARHLLLLLDNFEQVVSAAPRVAELLASCPKLKVLVTSREPLHLRGEKEFAVPPLALPDPKHIPSLDALSQYAAVELFIQRALDVKTDFSVTNETAPAIAEICYRLDGLPLALELAAARIKLLPPQAMLARLQQRLKFLTAGARDLPARQQTLRSAIDWSYDLLDEAEKKLFRRLAVFVGGCTFEAAEAVSHAAADPGIEIFDGLASLVNKSLLRQQETARGEPRFVMLETIREYALERLERSGEVEAIRRRHADFFLRLSEESELRLLSADRSLWVERLEAEHDNFRAVLAWSLATGENAEIGLRLAGALGWFWNQRGYQSEGREWLERTLSSTGAAGSILARAQGLFSVGYMTLEQGEFAASRSALLESMAIWRELGDKRGLARSLLFLGTGTIFQGDDVAANAWLGESVALFREVGDKWGLAHALFGWGLAAHAHGDGAAARARFEESLLLWRETGDKWGISNPLTGLGRVALMEGDYATARILLEKSLVLRREAGDKWLTAHSLQVLGILARAQQDYARAASLFGEALTLFKETGGKQGIALCLAGFAGLAGAQGRPIRAARLFGAAEALVESIGATMFLAERADYEHHVAMTRALLDEASLAKMWAEGRGMNMERAIAYALEDRA